MLAILDVALEDLLRIGPLPSRLPTIVCIWNGEELSIMSKGNGIGLSGSLVLVDLLPEASYTARKLLSVGFFNFRMPYMHLVIRVVTCYVAAFTTS